MGQTDAQRDTHGRFARTIADQALVTIVREVCLFVAERADPPIRPVDVTTAAFDSSRAAAGYPKVKRAWRICEQLGLKWSELKRSIFTSDASTTQTLNAAKRRERENPAREDAIRSIKTVAARLGTANLRGTAYEDERLRAVDEERLHWRHRRQVGERLLSLAQIEHIAPFAELAVEAGLEQTKPTHGSDKGVARLDAVAGFYEELGYLPASGDALVAYAKAKGYALANRGINGERGVKQTVRAFVERWEKEHGKDLTEVPEIDRRPPSDVQPAGAVPSARRRGSWSLQDCFEALVKVISENPGKSISQKGYRRLVRGRPDLPDASIIGYWAKKHGTTFVELRDEAVKLVHTGGTYAARMALDTPPPELDQAALAKKFAPQFEAAENLRAYAWTHRPRDRATDGKVYRSLLFAIFARATLTYRGILHLCRGGYTEQADMLTRSLFEDMAIALWVSLADHQEEAVELLQKHNDFGRLLAADSIEKHADWLGPVPFDLDDLAELEKNRTGYEKLFGRYGEKSWVTKSLHAILEEVEHLWEDEERRKQELWGYYALGHRINNLKLHSSALSLNQAAKQSGFEDGTAIIRLGASPNDDEQPMIRSLYGAMFTYGRIARLIIQETGGEVEAFDTFYGQQLDLAYKLAPSRRGKIERNDQCPCGSGKKFKFCHGA